MPNRETADLPSRIHLIGIGGIGLSAIARVLLSWGHAISGSDLRSSAITKDLGRLGATIYLGHAREHVAGAELVVVSSAVPDTNVELMAAREADIPVVKRQQLLGHMMLGKHGIAVAGTHGKTTTTAMIATILEALDLSPTFIVGGIMSKLEINARAGAGPHFVIEADEYDRMFHGLRPRTAVVTNLEMDHPDCFVDIEDMRSAFIQFMELVPPEGTIVACADSAVLSQILCGKAWQPQVITYGLNEGANYRIVGLQSTARGGVSFEVQRSAEHWATVSLGVPGWHNALNALAALLVSQSLGIEPQRAAAVLGDFEGVKRRFEIKGEVRGITVIDDYAHHPTEIRATLAAARARYPRSQLWALWQPHTFSRIEALYDEFRTAFADADQVIVMDVYAARASEKATFSSAQLAGDLDHEHAQYLGGADRVVAYLMPKLRPGDIVITLGAGDGYRTGEQILGSLGER